MPLLPKINLKPLIRIIVLLCCVSYALSVRAQQSLLHEQGISIIPYPKEAVLNDKNFMLGDDIAIVLKSNASESDKFAANDLIDALKEKTGVALKIGKATAKKSIFLNRRPGYKKIHPEGYTLHVDDGKIIIDASDEAGLFYGVQTVTQLIKKDTEGYFIKGIKINDWPDTKQRAVHYDTKHHQDTRAFVENFIRDLARYRINMLVWEWEDKFEYPSHPEIGAPGAFTMKEMQEMTLYARKYHIQIVPLVQGLGHAGFILKWPQYAHLREIPASNFEFCPLKDGSYALLDDLWKDAIEATPGSAYLHIGTDETYELGACNDCKKKQAEIGRSGLFHLFVSRAAAYVTGQGRKVMAWESPMGWDKGRLRVYHSETGVEKPVAPYRGLILTESYDYETPDLKYARQAKAMGYPVFAYDPNPGIEQLFLPYFLGKGDDNDTVSGCLKNSYDFLKQNLGKGVFDGVIRTSWDDSGLPVQAWMLSFATTAAYAWNASAPALQEFTQTFFKNRYGEKEAGMDTLYYLLNEGAYFYMESFERRVWAWGEIGKTHLPDLPRGDAVEYDPFWNTRYADRVQAAEEFLKKMDRAAEICRRNLAENNIDNRYDIEIFQSLVNLIRHTALTYLDLSHLENAVKYAHQQRFLNFNSCYEGLLRAKQIVEGQLSRRAEVYNNLVALWEKTRLPKGMSTPDKKYFFEQERTRHFANRVPDMSYLIYDEQLLNLEYYLSRLEKYILFFHNRFLKK